MLCYFLNLYHQPETEEYLHFIDEATEAQSSEVTCPSSWSQLAVEPGLESRSDCERSMRWLWEVPDPRAWPTAVLSGGLVLFPAK